MYGVSQAKWYEESNDKESPGQLKNVGQIDDFEVREQILKQNRPTLMKAIRFYFLKFVYSSNSLSPYQEQSEHDLQSVPWSLF